MLSVSLQIQLEDSLECKQPLTYLKHEYCLLMHLGNQVYSVLCQAACVEFWLEAGSSAACCHLALLQTEVAVGNLDNSIDVCSGQSHLASLSQVQTP